MKLKRILFSILLVCLMLLTPLTLALANGASPTPVPEDISTTDSLDQNPNGEEPSNETLRVPSVSDWEIWLRSDSSTLLLDDVDQVIGTVKSVKGVQKYKPGAFDGNEEEFEVVLLVQVPQNYNFFRISSNTKTNLLRIKLRYGESGHEQFIYGWIDTTQIDDWGTVLSELNYYAGLRASEAACDASEAALDASEVALDASEAAMGAINAITASDHQKDSPADDSTRQIVVNIGAETKVFLVKSLAVCAAFITLLFLLFYFRDYLGSLIEQSKKPRQNNAYDTEIPTAEPLHPSDQTIKKQADELDRNESEVKKREEGIGIKAELPEPPKPAWKDLIDHANALVDKNQLESWKGAFQEKKFHPQSIQPVSGLGDKYYELDTLSRADHLAAFRGNEEKQKVLYVIPSFNNSDLKDQDIRTFFEVDTKTGEHPRSYRIERPAIAILVPENSKYYKIKDRGLLVKFIMEQNQELDQ